MEAEQNAARTTVIVTLEGPDARNLAVRLGAWVRQIAGTAVCPDVVVTVQTVHHNDGTQESRS